MNNNHDKKTEVTTFMDIVIPRVTFETDNYRTVHNTPSNSPEQNNQPSPFIHTLNMSNFTMSNLQRNVNSKLDGELLHSISSMKIHSDDTKERNNNLNITGKKRKRGVIREQLNDSFKKPSIRCKMIKGNDTVNDKEIIDNFLEGAYEFDFGNSGTGLVYNCPTDRIGKIFKVKLTIENGVTIFSCDCNNVTKNRYNIKGECSHIRDTVTKIMLDLVNSL